MKIHLFTTSAVLASVCFLAACDRPIDPAVPKPTTTIGTEIDDSVISARVKAMLLADPDIKGLDFQVETHKGEVQLSGFVDNKLQIDHAIYTAGKVEGVKSVVNNVSLKGAPASVGTVIDDGIVTTRVKTALLGDPLIKSLDISVVTRKGEVQLSGFVDSQDQIKRAIDLASAVEGVRTVNNEMTTKK